MGALTKAAQGGDTREILVALRTQITNAIEDTDSGRDIAALSKRLIEVQTALDALPDPTSELSPVDEAQLKMRTGAG